MRLKSELWVKAYLRRCASAGAYGAISRRGEASAGAIFIEILHADGTDLYGPQPGAADRAFERLVEKGSGLDVAERMASEVAFDRDLWLVTIEDPPGRTFLMGEEGG